MADTGSNRELPTDIELPRRPFLFTMDQLRAMLQLSDRQLRRHLWFRGRSTYARDKDMMVAVNIAAEDEKPEWRVSEDELSRWLAYKGFKVR